MESLLAETQPTVNYGTGTTVNGGYGNGASASVTCVDPARLVVDANSLPAKLWSAVCAGDNSDAWWEVNGVKVDDSIACKGTQHEHTMWYVHTYIPSVINNAWFRGILCSQYYIILHTY